MKKVTLLFSVNIRNIKAFLLLITIHAFFSPVTFAQSDVKDLPPLDELGAGTYKGYTGGLYPNGSNKMPPAFYADAVEFARSIQPLNSKGDPAANGKIGVVGIGASTVAMFGEGLDRLFYSVKGLRKDLVFVNGGIGGQDLNKIYDQQGKYWLTVNDRISQAGLSNEQVQVVWIQEDDLKNSTAAFPERADMLADEFTYAIQKLKIRYPNLKFVYMTGRHNTVFLPADAKDKHEEPRPYENGWACKFIIERQINGDPELAYKGKDAKAPMIIWGPYFWTQGEKPRADGYTFTKDLISGDGVHPTEAGKLRVANDILNFWKKDDVSQLWFLDKPGEIEPVSVDTSIAVAAYTSEDYINLIVMEKPMARFSKSEVNGDLRVKIIKDTIAVIDQVVKVKDTINIYDLKPGIYKYSITDNGTLSNSGRFMVDSDLTVQVKAPKNSKPGKDAIAQDTTRQKNNVPEDEPAWFINGANKMPKLHRFMPNEDYVKAVFRTPDGEAVLEIEDVFNKHSSINEKLERGEYDLTFYDEDGKVIPMADRPVPERIRIK